MPLDAIVHPPGHIKVPALLPRNACLRLHDTAPPPERARRFRVPRPHRARRLLHAAHDPPCSTPGRYPVGYDPDRRARPYAPRWAMPVGYDPRRRPPLRPSDTPAGMDPPRTDAGASAYAECIQDPTRHVCTGIWMGRSIIDRRSLDP